MWWPVSRFAGSSLGLKCVVGAKVCRVKPWTEVCGGRCQGLQDQLGFICMRLMDIGVCKVKPLYVVGGGCWGWQGQAS